MIAASWMLWSTGMNRITQRRWSALLTGAVLVGALVLPGLAEAGSAGRIIGVTGAVSILRDGATLNAKADTVLQSGDTLVTSSDGRVQWQAADEALSALLPNSRFTINECFYPDGASAHYELKAGGFGTVSGLIQGPGYKVVTPAADITVEGTKYKALVCSGNCSGLPDGMYVAVIAGKVTVVNGAGSVTGNANQFIHVAGRDAAPRLVDGAPEVLASLSLEFEFEFDADGLAEVIERRLDADRPAELIERRLSPS